MGWFKALFLEKPISKKDIDQEIKKALSAHFYNSIKSLDVKDGDILVLRHPHIMSEGTRETLRNEIKNILDEFGFKISVIVLEEGLSLDILRKEKV